jgi:hypothetical protein
LAMTIYSTETCSGSIIEIMSFKTSFQLIKAVSYVFVFI